MTTVHHTPIVPGSDLDTAPANAALGSLDAAIVAADAARTAGDLAEAAARTAAIAASVNAEAGTRAAADAAEMAARIAADAAIVLAGSGVTTALDGTAASGQKVIPLAATTGITAGASFYIAKADGSAAEAGVVDTVSAGVSVTAVANLVTAYASGDVFSISPAEIAVARDTYATLGARLDGIDVRGRGRLLAYDEFSRYPDGALAGRVPLVGPAWVVTGSTPPSVTSGLMSCDPGSGYAMLTLTEPASYLECTMVFSGTDAGDNPMTMAWATTDLADLLHPNWGQRGFSMTLRLAGGTFEPFLEGAWQGPILTDGVTKYRFGVWVRGYTVTVIGPSGEMFSNSDPRVSTLAALTTVFWEPSKAGGNIARVVSIRALARPDDTVSIDHAPSVLDLSQMSHGKRTSRTDETFGAYEKHWETRIGVDPTGVGMGLTTGPVRVRTYLTSAASIGATTIVTESPLYPGTTLIGAGDGQESVTVTGVPSPYPGGGWPYTATLSAPLAKAHAAGIVVVGAGGTQRYLSVNPYSGRWQMNAPIDIFKGSVGAIRAPMSVASVSGAVTVDLVTYTHWVLTLTGNITSLALANPPASGAIVTIHFLQGGTGGYTISGDSAYWRWAGGSPPALTAAVGSCDIVRFASTGNESLYEIARSMDVR